MLKRGAMTKKKAHNDHFHNHAAKGLEWLIVFIPAVYNGSRPLAQSKDNNEEIRLLDVAITRAKSLLYLGYPLFSSSGNGERNQLSSFGESMSGLFAKKGPCPDRPVIEPLGLLPERFIAVKEFESK
jgi:DNA helicase-2/ATP-dependent DNA helicase PcrA